VPRLLDASTAFRTDPDWVYGFPEMKRGQAEVIAQAARVSNPGCYPTGAIALLRPLIEAGLLPGDHPVAINAVSGYSGGGRSMIEEHERLGGPAFELYGLSLEHKHVPEIKVQAGLGVRPIFVPSVGHFRQGMIVSIPLHLDLLPGTVTGADLHAALSDWYALTDRISVVDATEPANLVGEALAGSDAMELRVHAHDGYRHVLLTARLDNLGKGASGAAIQNIALMLGLEQPALLSAEA
jgi:N-acetyl-gamma-glutamyl-phosphate reductase